MEGEKVQKLVSPEALLERFELLESSLRGFALLQCYDEELFVLQNRVNSLVDALFGFGDEIVSLRNALEEGGE